MAPISPAAVDPYVDAFQKFPDLKSNGFSFLIDASSKLFTKAKPSLKDVEVNIEARNTALEINRTVLFLLWYDSIFATCFGSGDPCRDAGNERARPLFKPPSEIMHIDFLWKRTALSQGHSQRNGMCAIMELENGAWSSTTRFLKAFSKNDGFIFSTDGFPGGKPVFLYHVRFSWSCPLGMHQFIALSGKPLSQTCPTSKRCTATTHSGSQRTTWKKWDMRILADNLHRSFKKIPSAVNEPRAINAFHSWVKLQDFSTNHPDMVDEDDDDPNSCDTLSELGSQTPSSASVVTPREKHDKKLGRLDQQAEDWKLHTPSKSSKESKSEAELLEIANTLKMAMEAAKKSSESEKNGGLPLHVS